MAIPESIKKNKPTEFGALEIRCFGDGKYYVYQITSKWDAEKNRPKKVTGKSIGKITEADGFIPNANGLRLMKEMRITPDIAPIVKNYGAYEMLQQLSPDMEGQLRKFFPDIYREIRTLSLLRLVDSISSAKMIQPVFLDSYMSDICSDIAVSEGSVRRFVSKLGRMQENLDAFMKAQVMPGTTLLFDGTSIFSRSADSLSAKGYNPAGQNSVHFREGITQAGLLPGCPGLYCGQVSIHGYSTGSGMQRLHHYCGQRILLQEESLRVDGCRHDLHSSASGQHSEC